MLPKAESLVVSMLVALSITTASWAEDWSATHAKAKEMWDAGQQPAAIAHLNQYASRDGSTKRDQFLATYSIAVFYYGEKRYKEAAEYYQQAIAKHTVAEDDGGALWISTYGQLASALYQLGRNDEALQVLDALEKAKLPEGLRGHVYLAMQIKPSIYSGKREYAKAFRALLEDIDHRGGEVVGSSLLSSCYSKMPDPMQAIEDYDKDMARLWQALFSMIHSQTSVHDVYSIILDLMLKQGEYDRALFEAKNLVAISSTNEQMTKAVSYLSIAVKASDGSVHRANTFLAYQRYGKAGEDGKMGTTDDLANPFADMKYTSSPERDEMFEAALKKVPRSWEGRLGRARLCHVWGRPTEALRELKVAFALCPMEQEPLQRVTDQVVSTLTEITGDLSMGNAFVQFQKSGAAGPDGKIGTTDDLINPIATVLGEDK